MYLLWLPLERTTDYMTLLVYFNTKPWQPCGNSKNVEEHMAYFDANPWKDHFRNSIPSWNEQFVCFFFIFSFFFSLTTGIHCHATASRILAFFLRELKVTRFATFAEPWRYHFRCRPADSVSLTHDLPFPWRRCHKETRMINIQFTVVVVVVVVVVTKAAFVVAKDTVLAIVPKHYTPN